MKIICGAVLLLLDYVVNADLSFPYVQKIGEEKVEQTLTIYVLALCGLMSVKCFVSPLCMGRGNKRHCSCKINLWFCLNCARAATNSS